MEASSSTTSIAHNVGASTRRGEGVAGSAYRSGPPPPAYAETQPQHLHPHYHGQARIPKLEESDGGPLRNGPAERGISEAGRITINNSAGALEIAKQLAAPDESIKWFWTFDSNGQPTMTRYSTGTTAPRDSSSPSTLRVVSSLGNRGRKLRPQQSLASSSIEPPRYLEPYDDLDDVLDSKAPKWNAFGRLAPWVSGITGPLTGQGEEQASITDVGPGQQSQLGERRPRRGDKETNDKLRLRVSALQRAGVRSLLTSPPPRRPELAAEDIRKRRASSPLLSEHDAAPASSQAYLSTSAIAPSVLQPVLTPVDLLESRTYKHIFENTHIGALAKTTLDLGESEAEVRKAVGRLWSALEEEEYRVGDRRRRPRRLLNGEEGEGVNGQKRTRINRRKWRTTFSPETIGGEGASEGRPMDELNPTFSRLEDLFITREGGGLVLPILPPPGQEGEGVGMLDSESGEAINTSLSSDGVAHPPVPPAQPIQESETIPPQAQQDILLMSLSYITELESDSNEYADRLAEIRGKLLQVSRKRDRIWRAVKTWAVEKLEKELDELRAQQEQQDKADEADKARTGNGDVAS